MKNCLFLAFTILFLSCNSDESAKIADFKPVIDNNQNPLIGKWKLIERLADPGDGSGIFNPVQSDKTIDFRSDLTFQSSKTLCVMIPSSHDIGTGKYSIEESKLFPANCTNTTELQLTLADDILIIYYFCIEPCAEKYERISENN